MEQKLDEPLISPSGDVILPERRYDTNQPLDDWINEPEGQVHAFHVTGKPKDINEFYHRCLLGESNGECFGDTLDDAKQDFREHFFNFLLLHNFNQAQIRLLSTLLVNCIRRDGEVKGELSRRTSDSLLIEAKKLTTDKENKPNPPNNFAQHIKYKFKVDKRPKREINCCEYLCSLLCTCCCNYKEFVVIYDIQVLRIRGKEEIHLKRDKPVNHADQTFDFYTNKLSGKSDSSSGGPLGNIFSFLFGPKKSEEHNGNGHPPQTIYNNYRDAPKRRRRRDSHTDDEDDEERGLLEEDRK